MIKSTFWTFILSLILVSTLVAQQDLNFGFEKKSVEGLSRPWGWSLDAWGTNVFQMDSMNPYKGTFSLMAHNEASSAQHIPALQCNPEPHALLGKQVNLAGHIRTEIDSGMTSISYGYSVIDDQGAYLDTSMVIYKNDQKGPWQPFFVSFFTPKNTVSLFLKIHFNGKGRVWYDDLQFVIKGQSYTALPVADSISIRQMSWIENNTLPFETVEPKKVTELSFLNNYVGASSILAVGESTHGTSEFFKLKHKVLKYAVEHLGYRIFAIEDNMAICDKVNDYVLSKNTLTAQEAMKGMFSVWNTTEVLKLVEWLKSYNDAHPDDPVYFYGFDMQEYRKSLENFLAFLKKYNPKLYDKAQIHLKDYSQTADNHMTLSDSLKQSWSDNYLGFYKEVYVHFSERMQHISNEQQRHDINRGMQDGMLLAQYVENTIKGHWSLYRDEAMAQNVKWIMNLHRDKKMIIWAHDVHIAKGGHENELFDLNQGKSMGRFLTENYGQDYKAFGLMTFDGAYLALQSYTNFERIHAPLYPAPIGSLEQALHHASNTKGEPNLFLPFDSSQKWLYEPRPIRFANHVNIEYGFWQKVSLIDQFDGVFFMDRTSPSKYLEGKK